jgi:aspartokinase
METIAVYWERRIKTYGFEKLADLALIEFSYPLGRIKSLGEILSQNDLQALNPKFMIAQESDGEISLLLCAAADKGKRFHESVKRETARASLRYIHPVGIIFFHGPHFGDRYGIADATFSALLRSDIPILASGCSSSSIYLVLAQDSVDKAVEVLSKPFEVAK